MPPRCESLPCLVDHEVVTVLRHDAVQVPEWIAVVPNALAIVHLQELAGGGCPNVILTHVVEVNLVLAINGRLGTNHGVDKVSSFHFDV